MQTIPLTHGKVALVDDETYTLVLPRKWHARLIKGCWYVRTNITRPNGRKTLLDMHRLIMGAVAGQRVDHRDGDGLNNCRDNLRFCTHAQNMQNRRPKNGRKSSRFHGVSFRAASGKWIAQIKRVGQNGEAARYLGTYVDECEAARAYDRAAIKHFGEFAATNFPREQYQ